LKPSKPSYTLAGHSHNVCAVSALGDGKRIVSASWDMTARVWEFKEGSEGREGEEGGKGEWECERVLVGHGGAVWDVLLLEKEPEFVLTGSFFFPFPASLADKTDENSLRRLPYPPLRRV
jgi:WD40 repeat protein